MDLVDIFELLETKSVHEIRKIISYERNKEKRDQLKAALRYIEEGE